jgi:hypothetical protein
VPEEEEDEDIIMTMKITLTLNYFLILNLTGTFLLTSQFVVYYVHSNQLDEMFILSLLN